MGERASEAGQSEAAGGISYYIVQSIAIDKIYILTYCVQVERELEEWREQVISDGEQFWRTFLSETAVEEEGFDPERRRFFHSSVQPLLAVRRHLKSYLRKERGRGRGEGGEGEEERGGGDVEGLCKRVEAVRQQLREVQTSLREELEKVQSEMTVFEDTKTPSVEEDR